METKRFSPADLASGMPAHNVQAGTYPQKEQNQAKKDSSQKDSNAGKRFAGTAGAAVGGAVIGGAAVAGGRYLGNLGNLEDPENTEELSEDTTEIVDDSQLASDNPADVAEKEDMDSGEQNLESVHINAPEEAQVNIDVQGSEFGINSEPMQVNVTVNVNTPTVEAEAENASLQAPMSAEPIPSSEPQLVEPEEIDINDDNIAEVTAVDLNGDGIDDTINGDLNGDGEVDFQLSEADEGNEMVIDLNGDGQADIVVATNDDGTMEATILQGDNINVDSIAAAEPSDPEYFDEPVDVLADGGENIDTYEDDSMEDLPEEHLDEELADNDYDLNDSVSFDDFADNGIDEGDGMDDFGLDIDFA